MAFHLGPIAAGVASILSTHKKTNAPIVDMREIAAALLSTRKEKEITITVKVK